MRIGIGWTVLLIGLSLGCQLLHSHPLKPSSHWTERNPVWDPPAATQANPSSNPTTHSTIDVARANVSGADSDHAGVSESPNGPTRALTPTVEAQGAASAAPPVTLASAAPPTDGAPAANFASATVAASADGSPPGEASLAQKASSNAVENVAQARAIVDRSIDFYTRNDKFTCRVTRQEKVGSRMQPRELMLMNYRSKPHGVYYRWLDERHFGRECLWVEGENDGKMITIGGKGDFLFAGKLMALDPNGVLARSKGRYSITDSGMDRMVARLSRNLRAYERREQGYGSIVYAGVEQRPDLERPTTHLVQKILPGQDAIFPSGGTRHWFFDVKTSQVMLNCANNPDGEQVEYYRFDRFIYNPSLESRDFDPRVLWPNQDLVEEESPRPRRRIAVGNKSQPK